MDEMSHPRARMSMQGTALVGNAEQKVHQHGCFIETRCPLTLMTFNPCSVDNAVNEMTLVSGFENR